MTVENEKGIQTKRNASAMRKYHKRYNNEVKNGNDCKVNSSENCRPVRERRAPKCYADYV